MIWEQALGVHGLRCYRAVSPHTGATFEIRYDPSAPSPWQVWTIYTDTAVTDDESGWNTLSEAQDWALVLDEEYAY